MTKTKRYKLHLKCGEKQTTVYGKDLKHLQVYRFHQQIWKAFRAKVLVWNPTVENQVSDVEWHGSSLTTDNRLVKWKVYDRLPPIVSAAKMLGQIGGRNGRGKSKVRGDSNHYRMLQKIGQLQKQIKRLKKLDQSE